jgi:uncharacterized membrane protein YuzA (DUF378 family)
MVEVVNPKPISHSGWFGPNSASIIQSAMVYGIVLLTGLWMFMAFGTPSASWRKRPPRD